MPSAIFFLSCCLASFLLCIIAVITKTSTEMIDGHKTQVTIGEIIVGHSFLLDFFLCCAWVLFVHFCFLFVLVDITSYAMWTVSCSRLI